MSYFPEDIPFMSEEERKANGIKTAKEIEAQKTQLSEEDATFDCVSRQKAISEAKKLYAMGDCYCDEYSMVCMLNSLPPAQPESCDGCKWEYAFGYGECHHCKRRFNDMYEETNDE